VPVKRAVITAAGEGSRMLPLTRGIRKEMLPLYCRNSKSGLSMKPTLHLILEQLYELGIRSFCFVVREGEHMVQDYFTLRPEYIESLKSAKKYSPEIEDLRNLLSDIELKYVYQRTPKGFGDAVLSAKSFVSDDEFLLHAGDGYLLRGKKLLLDLIQKHDSLDASATLIVRKVEDPSKYGVVTPGDSAPGGVLEVKAVEEKPKRPTSNLALLPIYAFKPDIMDLLTGVNPGKTGEVELTDGIMQLIRTKGRVFALRLEDTDSQWLSVGNADRYFTSLQASKLQAEDSWSSAS
jgi:UTP--glucose-1-phosphate uridylyltransferase